MIRIATDSTADLSKELIDRYGIAVLPLHVIMDGDDRRDGIDITPEDIYRWSDEVKRTPKTSAASPEEALNFLQELTKDGDEAIVLTISTKMSTHFNVLNLAKEDCDHPENISVVDAANLSTGIGLLVIAAAEKAKEGWDREQIVSYLTELRPLVRASFVVDILTFLYRGGRCNGVAALIGGMLKLHPEIDVVDGAMQPGQKFRGKLSRVILDYAKGLEPALLRAKKEHVFITYSPGVDPEAVEAVRSYLESLNYFDEIHETNAGGVISSHCGPGTLGVLFIENP